MNAYDAIDIVIPPLPIIFELSKTGIRRNSIFLFEKPLANTMEKRMSKWLYQGIQHQTSLSTGHVLKVQSLLSALRNGSSTPCLVKCTVWRSSIREERRIERDP